MYVDSGLSFGASSEEVYRGKVLAVRLEGAGPGEQGRYISISSIIRSFWLLETSLYAFIWMCSFTMFLVIDTHATLSDGK